MMRLKGRKLAAGLVLFLLVSVGFGRIDEKSEEGSTSSKESGEQPSAPPRFRVEVVAPPVREGNTTDRYGSLITSVSEAQISDLNAQDLTSALRRVPGVSISRYNLIGAYGGADGGAIYVRGHGSGRPGAEISTMIDGVPRFVGVWTHPLIDTMSIDHIERVEIYKSPQPVLMGNMSFAAVNILPRISQPEGFEANYTGAYGEHDTWIQRMQFGGKKSGLRFGLNGSYRRSDGHRDNAGGQVWSVDGTLGAQLSEHWEISAYLSHTDGWADDPGSIHLPSPAVVPRFSTDDEFYLAAVSHDHGRWSGSLKLYYENGLIDWLQWNTAQSDSFRTVTDYDNYGFRFRERFRPWEEGEILFGFDQDFYGGTAVERWAAGSRNPIDLRFRNSAPYVMLSHGVDLGAFTLTPSAGVRFNSSRFFGKDWAPQAGLTVDRGKSRFYANYSNSFNLPGVYAASFYGSWGRGDQWKTLQPERINHLEAGLLHPLTRRTRLSWSVFHDRVKDALRFVPPPPPPPKFANVGDYRVTGTELNLDFFARDNLAVFTGANFQSTSPATVPHAPRWTWVSGLSYLIGARWRLNADAEWVDEQFLLNPRFAANQVAVGPYFLLNARIGYKLGRRYEVFAAAENLTDTQYEFRPGYPMPRATWMVGLNLGFSSEGN